MARVLADRDDRAFRALYRRHTPALYRFATRLAGGTGPAAEEITHDAWVRAVDGLDGFAWRSTFLTWLMGIAVNCWRGRLREQARPMVPLDSVQLAGRDSQFSAIDARIDLERAVTSLPSGYREVLVLHDLHGFTHEDIGRMLGIEPGTSKSQLHRARRAVRAALTGGKEPVS